MENLRKNYNFIIGEASRLSDVKQMLKEEQNSKSDELVKLYNTIDWKNRTEEDQKKLDQLHSEEKEIDTKREIAEIQKGLIINNLLSIMQKLLFESSEILKASKHYKKNLGPKTKEKIQDEITQEIKSKYNIDVYAYVTYNINYQDQQEYSISITFKDFYYCHDINQEKLILNTTTGEAHLYYYKKIDYVKNETIPEAAKKIYATYKESYNKIEELKKELSRIQSENNIGKICGLSNYYLGYRIIDR